MDDLIKKQKSTIFQLYGLFIATIILSFVPNAYAQTMALLLFLVLVVAVPLYKIAAPSGSLLKDHMGYLNGTIWLGSLLLTICVLIMGYWVYQESDRSAFDALFGQIDQGVMIGESEIVSAYERFMQSNMGLVIKASAVCIIPPMVYIAFRIFRALSRAGQGFRMGDF